MEMHPDIPLKDVYMFFDELPLVEGWELFVLRVFKNYCKHVFVCGSNAHVLSREMKSELRGWPYEVELWPLTFNEFCRFRGVNAGSHLERDRARVREVSELADVIISNDGTLAKLDQLIEKTVHNIVKLLPEEV